MRDSQPRSRRAPPQPPRPDDLPDPPPPPARENLMVAVRVRPLQPGETGRVLHVVDDTTVVLEDAQSGQPRQSQPQSQSQAQGAAERGYTFDRVLGEQATQQHVFEATVAPLVGDVLRGYHAAVFAYGATGSGKTHTMLGRPASPGIMVRALDQLFQGVARDPAYSVSLSYLEIYNENIRDLLSPGSGCLELRVDTRGAVQVAGLTQVAAASTDEVMSLLQQGNRERTVEPTAANQTSSRSHALLSVSVTHSADAGHRHRLRRGRLFMVDLAGSERASNTQNRGRRLAEGAHINRSLLALGNVISALAAGRGRYVNFRDSKLTRLLKDALSGSCRTVMLAHVSPAARHRDETRQTLLYAQRARRISNKVERNELEVSYHVSQYRAVIAELREEVERLRNKLEAQPAAEQDPHQDEQERRRAASLRDDIVATFQQQMALSFGCHVKILKTFFYRRRLMVLDGRLLALGADADQQRALISQWDSRLYRGPARASQRRGSADTSASGSGGWSDGEGEGGGAGGVLQQAWAELAELQRQQEHYRELRAETQRQLDQVRQHGEQLENELPGSGEERELLALLCRVHELEADKMALQGERLVRQYELQRRDALLQRYDRQRQLCEAIITRQRQLMQEGSVSIPPDLLELYKQYQREIHATSYATDMPLLPQTGDPYGNGNDKDEKDRLPPINQQPEEPLFHRSQRFSMEPDAWPHRADSEMSVLSPSSSAGSDGSLSSLPPITAPPVGGRFAGSPPSAVLFPPINTNPPQPHRMAQTPGPTEMVPSSRLPRPLPRNEVSGLRRSASQNNLSSARQMNRDTLWPDE
ncbi:kinesin-like protein KIF19 [Schistocerca nitens]|uniref:kinesin-like protein KIF19 n=1 Tax=Schistocerca nitens TaxID=7011 RepID=UPI0021182A85|nr:kinesin-like protein KIF19 [Schistocerca nitens]